MKENKLKSTFEFKMHYVLLREIKVLLSNKINVLVLFITTLLLFVFPFIFLIFDPNDPSKSYIFGATIAYVIVIMPLMLSLFSGQQVTEELTGGSFLKQSLVAPISRYQIAIGKALSIILVIIVNIVLVSISIAIVASMSNTITFTFYDFTILFFIFIISNTTLIALSFWLAFLIKKPKAFQGALTFVFIILLLTSTLQGIVPELVPYGLNIFSILNPLSHMTAILQESIGFDPTYGIAPGPIEFWGIFKLDVTASFLIATPLMIFVFVGYCSTVKNIGKLNLN